MGPLFRSCSWSGLGTLSLAVLLCVGAQRSCRGCWLLLVSPNQTKADGVGFAPKACHTLTFLEGNPSGRVNDACVVLSGNGEDGKLA